MWARLLELLGGASDTTEAALLARAVASLPAALGGLGLQSASRLALAAYWAAWADSSPVIQARFPDMAAQLQRHLGDDNARCLAHADAARRLLSDHRRLGRLPQLARHHGRPLGGATCRSRPRRLAARLAIPRVADSQPLLSRPRAVANLAARPPGLASLPIRAARGLLACRYPRRGSHHALAGSHASCASATTALASPNCLRALWPITRLRRASRLLGDHAPACPRTGLLARRAKVVERAWIRVAREAVGPEGHIVPQPWLARPAARPPTGCSTTCVPSHTWRRAGRRVGLEMHGPEPDRAPNPAAASSGYAARWRRSAAPSTSAPHGCGWPVRVNGETGVASQHSAIPLGVAP